MTAAILYKSENPGSQAVPLSSTENSETPMSDKIEHSDSLQAPRNEKDNHERNEGRAAMRGAERWAAMGGAGRWTAMGGAGRWAAMGGAGRWATKSWDTGCTLELSAFMLTYMEPTQGWACQHSFSLTPP